MLERYIVVFIGYSADDPPVQYLLEALNSKSVQHKIYAFEKGDEQSASAKWVHKGVTAIPFESFDLLWDTLASWAKRAHNPEEWCKEIIAKAYIGPTAMEPYERGLIAHIISFEQGAKLFFRAENTPPAEWLFVFDSKLRIEGPAHQRLIGLYESDDSDPFDLYGLDSDPAPSEITEYQQNALWNAFDRIPAGCHFSAESSEPDNRLKFLGSWLCKVMTQIEALQWASHQKGLPPEIQNMLDLQLKNIKSDDRIVAQAWRYLFESWQSPSTNELQLIPHALKEEIKNYGWSNFTFRQFTKSIQPYIHAGPRSSFWYSNLKDVTAPSHILHLDVVYPSPPQVEIPNEYLIKAARAIKQQLVLASQLEAEIGNERLRNLDTHIVSSTPNSSWRSQNEISAYVTLYLKTILKLKEHDINAAKREVLTWGFDNPIFVRLNIWAASEKELTSPSYADEIFCELDETAFWCIDHENDLMHSLAKRWTELSSSKRDQLEDRLLQGDSRYDSRDVADVDADSVRRYKANSSLSRLFWLKEQECSLSEKCLKQCEELKAIIPDQKFENIKLSAGSRGQFYSISPDYKYDDLLPLKISELIPEATKQSGHSHDHTKDNKPFSGLAVKHGWLAFFALKLAAKNGIYPENSWCEFLSHHVRENAEEHPLGLIAELISDCPLDISEELIYTISDWFNDKGQVLKASYPRAFQQLLNKLIELFQHNAHILNSRHSERTATEWLNASLNSPVGKITELLIQTLDTDEVKLTNQFPEWWLQAVESLLNLKHSLPALSFSMLTQYLSWFYSISPSWTQAHLLSALTGKHVDSRNAFWCGFLTRGSISYELMPELKSALYELAVDSEFKTGGFERNICALILLDWEEEQEKTAFLIAT